MTGLSIRNLKYMRAFAEAYPDREIVQQLAAQLPWGHTMALLDAVKMPDEREWYMRQTVENGWSRNVLVHQIDSPSMGCNAMADGWVLTIIPPTSNDHGFWCGRGPRLCRARECREAADA